MKSVFAGFEEICLLEHQNVASGFVSVGSRCQVAQLFVFATPRSLLGPSGHGGVGALQALSTGHAAEGRHKPAQPHAT